MVLGLSRQPFNLLCYADCAVVAYSKFTAMDAAGGRFAGEEAEKYHHLDVDLTLDL